MLPRLRGALSSVSARVAASRFAKPAARVALAAAGLLLLAFVGRTAVAGAMAPRPDPAALASASPAPSLSPAAPPPATASADPPPSSPPGPPADPASSPGATSRTGHNQATPDDPVILNTATTNDLRRLPGVGEKRAALILAVRARLGGRFHTVEDLLKVKGIGRTTLRRLRPLVRLDAPPGATADAAAP